MRVRTVCSLSSGRRLNSVPPQTSHTPSHLGALQLVVIGRAAIGAGEAPDDPADQLFLVDDQLDHMVELAAAFPEQDFKRFGLRLRARITVENRAACRRSRRAARRSAR